MKKLSIVPLLVFLFSSMGMTKEVVMPAKDENPISVLQKSKYFAFGPVGVTGATSPDEEAFKTLLLRENAVSLFEELLKDASNEGKMYALAGLFQKDPLLYQAAAARYKKRWFRKRKVTVMKGCEYWDTTDVEIMNQIEKGNYSIR